MKAALSTLYTLPHPPYSLRNRSLRNETLGRAISQFFSGFCRESRSALGNAWTVLKFSFGRFWGPKFHTPSAMTEAQQYTLIDIKKHHKLDLCVEENRQSNAEQLEDPTCFSVSKRMRVAFRVS